MKRFAGVMIVVLSITGYVSARDADFVVTDEPIASPLVGFGVCMNPYLYAYPNTPDEIKPEALKDLEAKVKALHPQFVRIFFLNSWWEKDTDNSVAKNHPGMRESVIRTIRLAQDAGASVLIQLWYDTNHYENAEDVARRFAKAIAEMRTKHGLTSIRYATIQNEPDENSDDIKMQRYPIVYRAFDKALRDEHIRDEVKIVSGDLVGEKWERWLKMLGMELAPVSDGYSIHSYWDYWRIGTFRQHIKEVAEVVEKMPPEQRRPLYVTEFGARGFREHPSIEPGKSDTGKPVADVPVYSFEIGIFMMDAINNGFVGTAQWDCYDVWYDRKMGYGVIGSVENGFPLKPGYWMLSLFTHATEPGWQPMRIDGEVDDVWINALKSKSDLSVFVLNRVHGEKKVTVSGLPAGKSLNSWIWNGDGKGTLQRAEAVSIDADGTATMSVPNMAIRVITTKEFGL
ncbi:MAG TPA: hypothetical protein VL282_02840 [Tepidisphaeraceae bacterium]|jgi:hypothetical protein|nr:hypothetical protein [Tepidisphaeraceae bacterium]